VSDNTTRGRRRGYKRLRRRVRRLTTYWFLLQNGQKRDKLTSNIRKNLNKI
jgi:hypothetical protein